MSRKIKRKIKKKKNGFTLIEMLLSLAIIVILTGASLSIARFSDIQKNLTLSANQLRALIRLAQSYALAVPSSGAHICGFGVYFTDQKTAQIFYTQASEAEFNDNAKTACNGHLKADGVTSFLDKAVLSVEASPTGIDKDIFFRVPYGQVYQNGDPINVDTDFVFKLSSNGATKDVTINGAGKIE